jgi:hypothetical protein
MREGALHEKGLFSWLSIEWGYVDKVTEGFESTITYTTVWVEVWNDMLVFYEGRASYYEDDARSCE